MAYHDCARVGSMVYHDWAGGHPVHAYPAAGLGEWTGLVTHSSHMAAKTKLQQALAVIEKNKQIIGQHEAQIQDLTSECNNLHGRNIEWSKNYYDLQQEYRSRFEDINKNYKDLKQKYQSVKTPVEKIQNAKRNGDNKLQEIMSYLKNADISDDSISLKCNDLKEHVLSQIFVTYVLQFFGEEKDNSFQLSNLLISRSKDTLKQHMKDDDFKRFEVEFWTFVNFGANKIFKSLDIH